MKCIFGHKYGTVQSDGFQYCARCGIARKPVIKPPCELNGHMWVDTGQVLNFFERNIYGEKSCTKVLISQRCSVCNNYRSVSKY